jgi:fibronectin type III domain protein
MTERPALSFRIAPLRPGAPAALRWASLTLASFLTLGSAHAATYYVRSDGNDASSGLSNSSASSWRTISRANAVLQPGDVVNVISLNPADTASATTNAINPSRSGTSSARITYIGNVASPQQLTVPEIKITRSHVTVRGFRANKASIFAPGGGTAAAYDVVTHCVIQNSFHFQGAQNSRVANNSMTLVCPQNQWGAMTFTGADGLFAKPWCERDTIEANTIRFTRVYGDNRALWVRGLSNGLVLARNNVSFVCDNTGYGNTASAMCLALYESFANYFHDNRWQVDALSNVGSGGRWYGVMMRSGTHHNLFERDTFAMAINTSDALQGVDVLFSAGNSLPDSTAGVQVHSNHWDQCQFFTRKGSIEFQNHMSGSTIENSVFVNLSGAALTIGNSNGGVNLKSSTIRHSTFYSGASEALHLVGDLPTGTNMIEGNIFYSALASGCSKVVESLSQRSGFSQDRNLFFAGSGGSGSAVKGVSQCYGVGGATSWCTAYGQDCGSRWGDPRLSSLSLMGFDARVPTGSAALDAKFPDGYAGAFGPGGVVVGDITAPAAVTNLNAIQIGDHSLILTWTAPGDDGNGGTPSAYDLRWSLEPITDTNFAAAATLGPAPQPQSSGATQTYVVMGLTPGTRYYYALKARDEANNVAALSNVASPITKTTDQLPPSTVGDLGGTP